jgi:3-oxoadipate enol-lactonase
MPPFAAWRCIFSHSAANRMIRTASINDIVLAYVDFGGGDPLLLVHGFPLDHSMWQGQIEEFSRRRRVIAPDLRGFGGSQATEGVVTMEQMADDLAALLDFLEIREPVVFCGLSMGGYIALEFRRKHADRLKALILCDTRAAADKPEVAANRLAMAGRVLREGPKPLVDSMLPKVFSPKTVIDRPRVVEEMERVMLRTDARGIAAAARGMAQRRDFTAELKNIRCPTLVLVGADDALSPPTEMQALAAAIPLAQSYIVPAAGHLAPYEQPHAANAAIAAFIDSLSV